VAGMYVWSQPNNGVVNHFPGAAAYSAKKDDNVPVVCQQTHLAKALRVMREIYIVQACDVVIILSVNKKYQASKG